MPRALKEWLKDLAARWSRVCRNTSIFRGLKLSPSSGRKETRSGVSTRVKEVAALFPLRIDDQKNSNKEM